MLIQPVQAPPIEGLDAQYSTFRGSPVKRLPVLRVFGATPAGLSIS